MTAELLALAHELTRRHEPFALATVVRCEPPTSAKPGATALIRRDGTVTGWIGGSCAEPLTVQQALAALADGRPRLFALVGAHGAGGRMGVQEHAMSCHSGGTLEIYVEPVLPRPQLVVVGSGPVVETLAALGRAVSLEVTVVEDAPRLAGLALGPDAAVVVATHGRFDEDALDRALRGDARYVSLVASPKRAGAVVEALQARGVPADRLARLKAPAGLDLGAATPEEIAVSILAEIVQARRRREPDVRAPGRRGAGAPPPGAREPEYDAAPPEVAGEARDPICGMPVSRATARYTSTLENRRFYFCGAGCKHRFDADPAPYAAGASAG